MTAAFIASKLALLRPFSSRFRRISRHSHRSNVQSPRTTRTFVMATDANSEVLDAETVLYPPIEPYIANNMQVSDTHSVYYEVSGNPRGLPVCFVHGGPGGGTVPAHRSFFNPEVYKIVLFDQRGCGKSLPTACIEENTTWDLVSDMERIREECSINKWILFGGSWGSTLSIAYAQMHPDRVIAMILRGIFMSRKCELEWLYERNGAAMLYPEAFQKYVNGLPEEQRNAPSLMHAYHKLLSSDEVSKERSDAAMAWSVWEHSLSTFLQDEQQAVRSVVRYAEDERLAFSRIESHYFVNLAFLESDGFLLSEQQMNKIKNINTIVIQARWDLVCPRKTAYDLVRRFDPDNVELEIVESAGHSTFEKGVKKILVNAADKFASTYGWMIDISANG